MGIKGYVIGYQMKTKFKVLNKLKGTQPQKVLNKFRMSGYQVRKVLKNQKVNVLKVVTAKEKTIKKQVAEFGTFGVKIDERKHSALLSQDVKKSTV